MKTLNVILGVLVLAAATLAAPAMLASIVAGSAGLLMLDFLIGSDVIELSASIFGAYAGQIGSTVELGANLSYNNASGALTYDADGTGAGAAMVFTILGAATHPTALGHEFLIVA